MSQFDCLTSDEWQLAQVVDDDRRQRLLYPSDFEDIVYKMLGQLELLRLAAEPAPKNQRGHRVSAQLRSEKTAVDLFFNSSSGYRAQYLRDADLGKKANRFVIDELIRVLSRAVCEPTTEEGLRLIFEASIAHPWAKVWIHQGPWLLFSRRSQRVLLVPSWQSELNSPDKHRRKLARWGSLAPAEETRLILKGGYVDSGALLMTGKSADTRGQELHSLGFT